jgi:hypothetical protein
MKEPTFSEIKERYYGKLVTCSFFDDVAIVVGLEDRTASGYELKLLFKDHLLKITTHHFAIIQLLQYTEETDEDENNEDDEVF